MYFYNIKLLKVSQEIIQLIAQYPKIIINKIYFFSLSFIKISEKTINFRDRKINKKDINKILISKPESYDKNNMRKYIIG